MRAHLSEDGAHLAAPCGAPIGKLPGDVGVPQRSTMHPEDVTCFKCRRYLEACAAMRRGETYYASMTVTQGELT